jgi:hypothetical protein
MATKLNADDIELRWKQLQIEELEERISARNEQKVRLAAERDRQLDDFEKNERIMKRRQEICKHRKGGRDNRFWDGNAPNYSIITNTYPTGEQAMMCTRCGKEVRKPGRKLRKEDPKLFASMAEEWKLWSSYPTDNTASGSKIFEIIEDAA